MAILKIYEFPDIVLSQKALPVEHAGKELRKVSENMIETMYHAPGIGLAANQIGLLKRVLVFDTEYESDETPSGMTVIRKKDPIVLLNPEVVKHEGTITLEEGCLSVPGYNADVKRFNKITVKYQDLDGVTKTLKADGLQAVCIQHEIDHLEGKLFIDRLSPLKKEMARKKLIRERNESALNDDFDDYEPKSLGAFSGAKKKSRNKEA